jgi:H-type small acid-soluble spore protein
MDAHRAKEIIQSKGYINIKYKHRPVLINEVYEYSDTALIKDIDKNALIEVQLKDLSETE